MSRIRRPSPSACRSNPMLILPWSLTIPFTVFWKQHRLWVSEHNLGFLIWSYARLLFHIWSPDWLKIMRTTVIQTILSWHLPLNSYGHIFSDRPFSAEWARRRGLFYQWTPSLSSKDETVPGESCASLLRLVQVSFVISSSQSEISKSWFTFDYPNCLKLIMTPQQILEKN